MSDGSEKSQYFVKFSVRFCCAVLLAVVCLMSVGGCGLVWIDETDPSATRPSVQTSEPVLPPLTQRDETSAPNVIDEFPSRLEEAEAALGNLFDKDLSGSDFLVIVPDNVRDTLFADENDPLRSTYLLRNGMVCEKYGCEFVYIRTDGAALKNDLKAAVKSGDYFGDLVMLPAEGAGSFAVEGLLMDLRQLSYYTPESRGNAGAGAYVKVKNNSFTVSNFFDISPAAGSAGSIYALFFNRSALGDAESEELYRACYKGRFTFEYFFTFLKKYGGKTAYDLCVGGGGTDDAAVLGEIAAVRSGADFVSDADGAYPEIKLAADENIVSSLTALITSLSGVKRYVPEPAAEPESQSAAVTEAVSTAEAAATEGVSSTEAAIPVMPPVSAYDIFASGESLFRIGTLSEIYDGLYAEKTEWGLLELPHAGWSDPDSVMNYCAPDRPVFCVPAGNSARIDLDALVLSALGVASKDWIRDQFAAICVEQYLRDNDSYFSLRRILDKEDYCDFSVIFRDSCTGLYDATAGAVRKCFADGTPVAETVSGLLAKVNKNLKSVYK